MHTTSSIKRIVDVPIIAALMLLAWTDAPAGSYSTAVLNDNPVSYYRFNEAAPADIASNQGSLGAAGNGTYRHDNAAQTTLHRVSGALAGDANAAASFQSTDGAPVLVPNQAALNPSGAFTAEAWVKATASTDDSASPCPLFNRKSASPRQGWVFFQRSPGTGWNFQTYGNGVNSTATVDITGGAYNVGDWVHLAATYDGTTARLYVNGAQVASGAVSAYQGNGSAALSVGSYSDLSGSGPAYQNPFAGNVDEVALYSTALSSNQIVAHYNNGTNPARTTSYSSLVIADGAVEYLRLDESDPNIDTAVNSGSLGAAADGWHFPGLTHQVTGALVGDGNTAASYSAIDTNSTDGGVPTIVPFNADINTGGSFTVEAWLKPTLPTASNQQCPLYNRITAGGAFPNRAGWDVFQQPTGWRFRMFNGTGGNTMFNVTGGPLTVNGWQHFVAVYDAAVPSLTVYINGASAGSSSSPSGTYAPNPSAPLAIGGFPLYSNGSFENPFSGPIDEVAVYTNALSAAAVLAHYQNATNAARAVPYSSLVLQTNKAIAYWRLDEPARNVAVNSGTLGASANGTYASVVNPIDNLMDRVFFSAPNSTNGPQSPTYAGFETNNTAGAFSGSTNYVELVNPGALNFSGQVTVEAWVLPDAVQGFESYIVGHGGNDTFTAEDALRIEDTSYQILSYDGTAHGTSVTIPGGDLGGGNWVHLVGAYDGANWNLYRNGILSSTTPDATGQLRVLNANWAIGARGRWKNGQGLERLFTGAVDEVAIYNYRLSGQRIAAHYSVGVLGANPITIVPSGTDVIITWPAGTLQEATEVIGPYSDVVATSPLTVPAGVPKKFYRLRLE